MNQELYDKTYKLPPDVLKHLQTALVSTPTGDGVRRAKFMLRNGSITYQAMKRIKSFFDNNGQKNPQEYQLAGGDLMKSFIERSLNQDRDAVSRSKDHRRDINIDVDNSARAQQTPRLNEDDDAVSDAVSDGANDAVQENALAIIVNKENQILLLRRGTDPTIWQPGKWALVGGEVEPGEDPVVACQREIKEETGLDISTFNHKVKIQRNPDSIEYIYICKYDGDEYAIELDTSENINYGWYSPGEIHYLNHVPNLIDYINIAFKNYD